MEKIMAFISSLFFGLAVGIATSSILIGVLIFFGVYSFCCFISFVLFINK